MSVIPTERIDLDINPTRRRADRRFRGLTAECFAAWFELMEEAALLNATTGSDYIDGEFSVAAVLKRSDYITPDALDALLDAELVWEVDGDRWAIDFSDQTSHESLQSRYDGYARSAETRKIQRQVRTADKHQAEEKAEHKRQQSAERSQRYRENQKAEPKVEPAIPDKMESMPEDDPWAPDAKPPEPDDKCVVCRRKEDALTGDGIFWMYGNRGLVKCAECFPDVAAMAARYEQPKPAKSSCWKCDKYGDRCFDHGKGKLGPNQWGLQVMEDEFVGAR